MHPTTYQIAVAIYAGAREVREHTEDVATIAVAVASHKVDGGANFPINRARSYAFTVLHDLFPHYPVRLIARTVGAHSADVWASKVMKGVRLGQLGWWNQEAYERVRAAVTWAIAREATEEPPARTILPGPAPAPGPTSLRPAESERQRKALQMLEQAAAYTATMQNRGMDGKKV
jgi:hypothetical protein